MGDSLSWAADQERERYENSDEFKANKARCEEWNILMTFIEAQRFIWTIEELRFLIRSKSVLSVQWDSCNITDLEMLTKLFEKCNE